MDHVYLVPDLDLMKICHMIHQDTSQYTGYIDEMLYPDACDALLRFVTCGASGAPLARGEASSSPWVPWVPHWRNLPWRHLPWQRARAPPRPRPRPRSRPRRPPRPSAHRPPRRSARLTSFTGWHELELSKEMQLHHATLAHPARVHQWLDVSMGVWKRAAMPVLPSRWPRWMAAVAADRCLCIQLYTPLHTESI